MSYNSVSRYLNRDEVYNAALINLKNNHEIFDNEKYDILMGGIIEDYENEDGELKDVLKLLVLNNETKEEETLIYYLAADLNICPKTMYNYYKYRFDPCDLKLGDAVRIVKEKKDENDLDWYAYNAVIIKGNGLQISYVMVPSRGPMTRRLTAREAYTHGIQVYKYKHPDDYEHQDGNNEGYNTSEVIL